MAEGYIGPESVVDELLMALLASGHVLLEGVPGIAKTTVAKRFSDCLGCTFSRVQFTQDILPGDITGAHIFNMQSRSFELHQGPIFANVVLGDEINRAPPKVQSALLEAMQEQQVTIDGKTMTLPDPFLVLATRNPIEQAGVYPLPEAQIDRFLVCISMGYPTAEDEARMLRTWRAKLKPPTPILNGEAIKSLREAVDEVHLAPELETYIVSLANASRNDARVELGASPRASLALARAARAWAYLYGRDHVLPEDIRSILSSVWSHRLVLTPEAQMNGVDGATVIQDLVEQIEFRGPASRVQ